MKIEDMLSNSYTTLAEPWIPAPGCYFRHRSGWVHKVVPRPADANPNIDADAVWVLWRDGERVDSWSRSAFMRDFEPVPAPAAREEG